MTLSGEVATMASMPWAFNTASARFRLNSMIRYLPAGPGAASRRLRLEAEVSRQGVGRRAHHREEARQLGITHAERRRGNHHAGTDAAIGVEHRRADRAGARRDLGIAEADACLADTLELGDQGGRIDDGVLGE